MKRTRISDLLNIEYPVMQAPMAWVCGAEMVSAVSNAGALGCISVNAGTKVALSDATAAGEVLRGQIRETRRLTGKPFAFNIMVGRGRFRTFSDRMLEVTIEEKVPAVIMTYLVQDDPGPYTRALKKAGIKVIHRPVECTVPVCKKVEESGADAVLVTGYEAGGHMGPDCLPLMALLPQVVDAVRIPVIANGGIADGRAFLAAMVLGAEGICVGTRFLATKECLVHDNVKNALLKATETSTVTFLTPNGMCRAMKNKVTGRVIEVLKQGGSMEDVERVAYRGNVKKGLIDGDLEEGMVNFGVVAGMVKDIISAGEVVQKLVKEYEELRIHVSRL